MFRRYLAIYANILHLRFTDTFADLPPQALNAISRNRLGARLWQVVLYTGGRLILNLFLPLKRKENISGKIWLYVVSKNNYESLQFIRQHLPDAVFVAGEILDERREHQLPARFEILTSSPPRTTRTIL